MFSDTGEHLCRSAISIKFCIFSEHLFIRTPVDGSSDGLLVSQPHQQSTPEDAGRGNMDASAAAALV